MGQKKKEKNCEKTQGTRQGVGGGGRTALQNLGGCRICNVQNALRGNLVTSKNSWPGGSARRDENDVKPVCPKREEMRRPNKKRGLPVIF